MTAKKAPTPLEKLDKQIDEARYVIEHGLVSDEIKKAQSRLVRLGKKRAELLTPTML